MLAILVILQIIGFGFLLSYFFRLKFLFEERIAASVVIGLVWLGYVTFGLALILGLNEFNLIIFIVITYVLMVLSATKENLINLREDFKDFTLRLKDKTWQLFYLILFLFILIFGFLGIQFLTFKNGTYYIQPVHSYGDISLHLSLISSFAYGNNFPPESPILAGEKISYPFLIDYINAVLVNPLGLPVEVSVAVTEVLLMTALIILFSFLVLRVTRSGVKFSDKGSKIASIIALLLLFLNGGLGFLIFFEDIKNSGLSFFDFVQNLQKDYTALKDIGFWWINIVLSMLLPQRSFLLGFPFALIIIRIFWDVSEKYNIKSFLFAVLLTAFLPLVHAHSLIALSFFVLYFTFLIMRVDFKRLKEVVGIGILGLVIAFILSTVYLQQSSAATDMIKVHIGWTNKGEDLLTYYFKNFGLILILIPISLIWGLYKKLELAVFVLIAQLWFFIPSIFIFQPWDFDNIKLFIYWYAFSIILVSFFFATMLKNLKAFAWILLPIILIPLVFSGFLDIFRLITSSGTRFEIYSPQAIELANFVKENTHPKSVFFRLINLIIQWWLLREEKLF